MAVSVNGRNSLNSGLFETSAPISASLRAYSAEQHMEPAAVSTGAGLLPRKS